MQNEELQVHSHSRSSWVRDLPESVATSFIFELFTQKSDNSERASTGHLFTPGSDWEALRDCFDSHGGRTGIWIYQPIKVANNQGELISPKNQAPGWNREWKLSLS